MKRHVLIGVAAASLLLFIYVGIITWAESFQHALQQTADLWYFVAALAIGFGAQAGLFSYLRHGLRQRQASATASVAASGGVSTGSMIACCAHHIADVLPVLGLSGVAVFLASYQSLFMIIGILSNVVGIIFMLDAIQCSGLSPRLSGLKWSIGRFKKGAVISAILLAGAVGIQTFITA